MVLGNAFFKVIKVSRYQGYYSYISIQKNIRKKQQVFINLITKGNKIFSQPHCTKKKKKS